jgi:hypothetical protein
VRFASSRPVVPPIGNSRTSVDLQEFGGSRNGALLKRCYLKRVPSFESITVNRLLQRFGIATYRITGAGHLYSLKDIEAIEEQAKHRAPLPGRSNWGKNPKEGAL